MPIHRLSLAALAAAGSICLSAAPAGAAPNPQIPIPGSAIPQFIQPLPLLGGTGLEVVTGSQPVTLTMCEFKSHVLPPGTLAPGVTPETSVWGYVAGTTCPTGVRETYLGPVVVNLRGVPTEMTFVNALGSAATTNVLAYRYSTDQTLHWADPLNGGANDCARTGGVPAFGSACAQNYEGPIPAVVHLHGGEVPPELDGGPDAWFTSDGASQGSAYYTRRAGPGNQAIYNYPNRQEAAAIWFHDHAMGVTRLNVIAGLAGAYLIVDPLLALPANLPGPSEIVPIVLQDRSFDTNGQFFVPADSAGGVLASPNPDHPYWVPEFTGDVIVVNGKAWPFLEVQPRRYRVLFVNGSNARTYELSLVNQTTGGVGPPLWIIGNDGGYLDKPVRVDRLTMMPGERYEAIVDFGALRAGTNLLLRNGARTPYPKGAPPNGATVARVMQLRVRGAAAPDASFDPALGGSLRAPAQATVRLAQNGALAAGVTAQKTRQLTLNEVMGMPVVATDPVTGTPNVKYPGGPLEILVNNTKFDGMSSRTYGDFVPFGTGMNGVLASELPQEGETELWEIVNLTADAHPMHLHLAQFQIVNRQAFNAGNYAKAYAAAFPAQGACAGAVFCPGFGPPLDYDTGNPRALGGNPDVVPFLQGMASPPLPSESGWKDTAIVPPGMVTRIAVRWAPTDLPVNTPASALKYPFDPSGAGMRGYVWHCHIIDHEDNEMMRPDFVQQNPAVTGPRLLLPGVDY